jgi:Ni,Fe-hydrogenase I cytochrome b subunit
MMGVRLLHWLALLNLLLLLADGLYNVVGALVAAVR